MLDGGSQVSEFLDCPALLINKVADKVNTSGKHTFSTPAVLQNQWNNLEKASTSLGLTVNLKKTKNTTTMNRETKIPMQFMSFNEEKNKQVSCGAGGGRSFISYTTKL